MADQALMDIDEGVDIWYQVEGREESLLKDFTGKYVDNLLRKITESSHLANPADSLQPFIKRQESDKEISLRKLENELGRNKLNFRELVSEYDIWKKNPIIIWLPVERKADEAMRIDSILALQKPCIRAFSHNFYDRERLIKDLVFVAESNYEARGNSSKTKHTMILIPGGSGIGKSRAGKESVHLVTHADRLNIKFNRIANDEIESFRDAFKDPWYILIDFSNECRYSQRLDEKHEASVRIGARIAVASGLVNEDLDLLLDNYPVKDFQLAKVMRKILDLRFQTSKRTLEAIIIHIEEYQIYIDRLQTHGKRDWLGARNYFKDMLSEIGGVMSTKNDDPNRQYFIIPICTGTSAIDLRFLPTEYHCMMVTLKPLDYDAAKRMFLDKYEYSRQTDKAKIKVIRNLQSYYAMSYDDNLSVDELSSRFCQSVWEQNHFQIALYDTGFIPRYMDFLLEYGDLNLHNDWGQNLYTKVNQVYESNVINQPNFWKSTDDIRATISLGITRQLVTREFVLPSGSSIGDIERDGLLFLSKANDGQSYFVVMPFMMMKILNERLLTSSDGPIIPSDLLKIPKVDRPWQWQDFERLHGYYQRALIESLILVRNTKILGMENRIKALVILRNAKPQAFETEFSYRNIFIEAEIIRAQADLVKAKQMEWKLSDIFRGAKGDPNYLQRNVKLSKKEVFVEGMKFLVEKTDVAEFRDDVLCNDGVERRLSEGIFHCADSSANIDYRWTIESACLDEDPFAIFMQDKHSALTTESDTVNYDYLHNWYNTTLQSVSEYHRFHRYTVILVFFTNRRYVGSPESLSGLRQLFLIDKSCIEDYLSPTLAHRGLVNFNWKAEQAVTQPM